MIASVLAWMSATINPFIYAFKNRQYQQAFKKVTAVSQPCLHLSYSCCVRTSPQLEEDRGPLLAKLVLSLGLVRLASLRWSTSRKARTR